MPRRAFLRLICLAAVTVVVAGGWAGGGNAQIKMPQPSPPDEATPDIRPSPNAPKKKRKPNPKAQDSAPRRGKVVISTTRETIEADVSTRAVAVTSAFSGTKIVVFGAVNGSRQEAPEAGLYDVIIVVEGTPVSLIVRKKSNVAGLWINTDAMQFERVPSYYTISSTRPVNEIASEKVLAENGIGFDLVAMHMPEAEGKRLSPEEIDAYKTAVLDLKRADRLYFESEFGVTFIGKSLFRSALDLPANVPVGKLTARVYLFRDGALLADHTSRVTLSRAGVERYLHDFAFDHPFFYGLFAVFLAVFAGLAASAIFNRDSH